MAKLVKQYSPKAKRSHKKRKSFSLSHKAAVFFLLLFAGALVISYLSILVSPKILWIPFFFGLYYIPLALANLILLFVALFRRSRLLLIPMIALLPSLFFADKYVKVGEEQQYYSGEGLKIMTYNLGRFSASDNKVKKSEIRGLIADYIKEENPDIVCLQEFSIKDTSEISVFLPDYPYCFSHLFHGSSTYFGNVTLSRYPIVGTEKILFSTSCNLCLVTDIEIGARTLRLFNCHLESYGISFTSLIKKLSDKDLFTDEIVQIHEHIRTASQRRAQQVELLAERGAESQYPLIVCGDFNDTPISYVYNTLSSGMKDGFEESGSGFGGSYAALWPLLRIDYILIPEEYHSSNYEIARVPYSDHYPVNTSIYFE